MLWQGYWAVVENSVPSELRYVMFRPDEVVEAVKEYRRRVGTPLPHGGVLECGPEGEQGNGGQVRFRIVFVPEAAKGSSVKPETENLLIEGPVLAAALILYCRDHRIPMSANSHKSIERMGNQLCLVARYSAKQAGSPQVTQARL